MHYTILVLLAQDPIQLRELTVLPLRIPAQLVQTVHLHQPRREHLRLVLIQTLHVMFLLPDRDVLEILRLDVLELEDVVVRVVLVLLLPQPDLLVDVDLDHLGALVDVAECIDERAVEVVAAADDERECVSVAHFGVQRLVEPLDVLLALRALGHVERRDGALALAQQLIDILVVVAHAEVLVEQHGHARGPDVDADAARHVLVGQRVVGLADDVDVVLEVQVLDFVFFLVFFLLHVFDVQQDVFGH